MKQQQQHIIGQTQEYPGTRIWYDYEVLCPECQEWVTDYGDVTTTDDDGEEHYLCIPCGDEVFPITPED